MLNIPASGNYESTTPHPGRGYTLLWVWCAAVNAFRMPTGSLNVQLDLPIGPRLLVQLFGGQKVGVVLQGVNQRSPWNFSWFPGLPPCTPLSVETTVRSPSSRWSSSPQSIVLGVAFRLPW